ncbi:hypothetical protein HFN60_02150 [Rhizobium leguminosarum]|uniref:hypothetical protein n=1 Tax=Rhizobium leguminosarum TaxID=384 RepID=UPI001C939B1B|nr:hypothetical protein [Rhizobium leguminosarum]MBY5814463.1 hypothetical protein [Rhizobium leguminosarum]
MAAREKPPERKPQVKRETQNSWLGRHNYVLNADTVLRDLYRLLNVVMADGPNALLATDESDVLVALRDQFVEDELVHLLIGTAVMNRSHDDHMTGPRDDESEMSFTHVDIACGRLINDVGGSKESDVDLSLREACNKIIHAEQITVEMEKLEGAVYPTLPKSIILRGSLGKRAWQATLDLPSYARATITNFRDIR